MQERLALLTQAAQAVARVESAGLGLPTSRSGAYHLRDRSAWRVNSEALELPVEWTPPGSAFAVESAMLPIAAVEVRLGKYSTPSRLRVRAFYPGTETDVTLKIVSEPDRARLRREVAARRVLRRPLDGFSPRVIASGEDCELAWLLEEVIKGAHPMDASSQHRATRQLAPALVELHRMGRELVPVSSLLGADTVNGLQGWLHGLPDDDPGRHLAVRAVGAAETLLGRSPVGLVHIGWCHGDAGFGNVLASQERVRLIDWEQVGRRLLGFDLIKLLAHTADADSHLRLFAELSSPAWRRRRALLPFDSHVAIAGLVMLSRSAETLARAHESGRLDLALATVRQRWKFVDLLLRRAGFVD